MLSAVQFSLEIFDVANGSFDYASLKEDEPKNPSSSNRQIYSSILIINNIILSDPLLLNSLNILCPLVYDTFRNVAGKVLFWQSNGWCVSVPKIVWSWYYVRMSDGSLADTARFENDRLSWFL
jgi:hypothetical protein